MALLRNKRNNRIVAYSPQLAQLDHMEVIVAEGEQAPAMEPQQVPDMADPVQPAKITLGNPPVVGNVPP